MDSAALSPAVWPRQTIFFVTLVALLLVTCAFGLRRISVANTDLESLPQLAADVRTIYAPTSSSNSTAGEAWWQSHASGLRAWKLVWLTLNGHVDSRLLQLGALALQVAAAGALFWVVAPLLPLRWAIAAAAGIVLLFETPALAITSPVTDSAWGSSLLLLSLIHLVGMSRSESNSWRWWIGLASGLVNVISASLGLASAFALVIWNLPRAAEDVATLRQRQRSLLANAILLLAAGALVAARTHAEGSVAWSFANAAIVSSPFTHAWEIAVLWAPAAWAITSAFRTHRANSAPLAYLALLAIWAAITAFIFSGLPPSPFAAGSTLTAFVVINALCFTTLPADNFHARTRNLLLIGAWAIVIGDAFLHPVNPPAPRSIQPDDALAVAIRQSLAARDPDLLPKPPELTLEERAAAAELVRHDRIHTLLPASIRAPLLFQPNGRGSPSGFDGSRLPNLPGRDELAAVGTFSAQGEPTTGEFVSAPLETRFPLLQFRVAGTLRPPATSLVLRASDGSETAPLNGNTTALDKWRRINFAAPRGPFQIVARDTSATEWLAFTAPTELGPYSRLASKLPRAWPWLLAAGLGTGVILGLAGWRQAWQAGTHPADSAPASPPTLDWRVAPWILICGYAVFFSHHLDTVAGPNDSGGYLNLAKTLAEGHVTAIPRTLAFFDSANVARDITPYLTTTFQPRSDGRMVAEYPVGFPLEIWAFAQILPLSLAVPTVMLLQLVLGIVFTRLLAKAFGLSDGWAWLAGGMVGLNAVYLYQALQPQSDGPALVWVTAAVYWAWSSRTTPWHAILAGVATTLAVLIRPSNLLCVVPVLLCLAGHRRQLLGWMLAGLPGAAFLAWYNHDLYGSWHSTGYGDVSTSFGWRYLPLTLRSYAAWLPKYFTPLLCLGLIGPFLPSIPGRARLVLASWAAVFLAFYAIYWCTWDNWYNMRFVLPAIPALLVLALLVLRQICARFGWILFTSGPAARHLVPSALLTMAIFAFQSKATIEHRVLYWTRANYEHAAAALWVREHVPANAVVFAKPATNSLWYYTDFVFLRSDHPKVRQSPDLFSRIASAGHPIYALTYHWEERGFQWNGDRRGTGYPDLPGTWERIAAPWEKEVYVWKQTSLSTAAAAE